MRRQTTKHILMVRPSYFGFNHETAANNAFQINDNSSTDEIRSTARKEYDELVQVLKDHGVHVISYSEDSKSKLTDSIFPNNWFSTHYEGTLVTYPMYSEVRRKERDSGVINLLNSMFDINDHIRLEKFETEKTFLEGTGSMILDRDCKKAYACRSVRTDESLLDSFCAKFEYEKVFFDATDKSQNPIYHTNVMMSIGNKIVIICGESIKDKYQKELVFKHLEADGKQLIDITFEQVNNFAGNVLEVKGIDGKPLLVMSTRAYDTFLLDQLDVIENSCSIVHSPIPTIEKYGGGGVRCMMAEIFLPQRS